MVAAMDLATELQKIYDSEINIEISWLWDGGIEVRLGDRMNGYLAEATVRSVADIIVWLQGAIAHFYPDSTYAHGLEPELKERAAHQIFFPPTMGAQVTCPHCGAPNPNHARTEEIIYFVCSRCGAAVEVKPPRVQ
jgi:DNA-directed RNA polymerase subunit RPC12/RpoP